MTRLTTLIFFFIALLASTDLSAQFFRHRQFSKNQSKVPALYDYGSDIKTSSKVIIAKADEAQNAKIELKPNALEKRFYVPVSGLETDRVALKNIGIRIDSTGNARLSGKMIHSGGPDGGLSGSNTTVNIRAFAGVQGSDNINDAVMVWSIAQKNWCYKNRPKVITLSSTPTQTAQLKREFAKITHVEIELEHEIDR